MLTASIHTLLIACHNCIGYTELKRKVTANDGFGGMGKEADWSLFEVILYISSERTVQSHEKHFNYLVTA